MKRTWQERDAGERFAPQSIIGRAHLDEATAAGQVAGRDLSKTMADCPYDGPGRLMTVKAWQKGFLETRVVAGERA